MNLISIASVYLLFLSSALSDNLVQERFVKWGNVEAMLDDAFSVEENFLKICKPSPFKTRRVVLPISSPNPHVDFEETLWDEAVPGLSVVTTKTKKSLNGQADGEVWLSCMCLDVVAFTEYLSQNQLPIPKFLGMSAEEARKRFVNLEEDSVDASGTGSMSLMLLEYPAHDLWAVWCMAFEDGRLKFAQFGRCSSWAQGLLDKGNKQGKSWELDVEAPKQKEPLAAPVGILSGPFTLDAQLTLTNLNGSAASLQFGSQLNFGFDGGKRTLFAEGSKLGVLKILDASNKHIMAGKPFNVHMERTASGQFSVSINGHEVFSMPKLNGPLPAPSIRPMRNVIDVHHFKLSGDIDLPDPGLHVSRRVIPILIDGEEHSVFEIDLVLEEPRELRQVAIDVSGHDSISSLALTQNGEVVMKAAQLGKRTALNGNVALSAGLHPFEVRASIKPGTDPLKILQVSCAGMSFVGKGVIKPEPTELPPVRLAYPIHKQGQFDCHTFRIPGIAEARDGSLLAVYDMRYNSRRDLQEHMDIGLSRSTDGGVSWVDPVAIMDMGEWGGKPQKENGCSDPGILVDDKTGEVFVFAVWTHGKPGTHQWRGKGSEPGHGVHRSSQFMMVRSQDHGKTWSKPENLTKDLKDPSWYLFAPAPGNGITMSDGTLVIPSQGRDARGHPFSNITWSKDHGKSWTVSSHARDNTTECAVAELSNGSLLLNMRDNRNRSDKSETNGRAMAQSSNLGGSWAVHPADHGALPEPTCMASMISHTLADGRHVLIFSNPRNRHDRKGMTIQLSFDDGKTWPEEHRLLLDSEGGGYSSLVMVDEDTIGILYESSQADMVFQKIALSELIR